MRRLYSFVAFAVLAMSGFGRLSAQAFPNFSVDFSNCTEFAGEGPVPLAQAAPLVPHGYTIASPSPGVANIVIRATGCGSATVNGRFPQQTNLSQIGVNIVSPDGTGTINNYTVVYLSNNAALVTAFNLAGLPAQFDPQLTYQFSAAATASGNLYVAAGSLEVPRYFIYGPETPPAPNSAQVFLANWWYSPKSVFASKQMRQQTLFPAISFGGSSVSFYTSSGSQLGNLIAGNTFSSFSALALRGIYESARMEVTVK